MQNFAFSSPITDSFKQIVVLTLALARLHTSSCFVSTFGFIKKLKNNNFNFVNKLAIKFVVFFISGLGHFFVSLKVIMCDSSKLYNDLGKAIPTPILPLT